MRTPWTLRATRRLKQDRTTNACTVRITCSKRALECQTVQKISPNVEKAPWLSTDAPQMFITDIKRACIVRITCSKRLNGYQNMRLKCQTLTLRAPASSGPLNVTQCKEAPQMSNTDMTRACIVRITCSKRALECQTVQKRRLQSQTLKLRAPASCG